MTQPSQYINTDLELTSSATLAPLADFLDNAGWLVLHAERHDDGLWHAAFEAESFDTPDGSIRSLLDGIEALPEPLRMTWNACSRRDFNMGYEVGAGPRTAEYSLPPDLLARIAALGAMLTVTIYAMTKDCSSTR